MEMARRAVRGEVAAVLGIEHLPFDMGSRAAFDQADIQRQIDALPPEQRDILRGYAAGINAGIRAAEADPDALMPSSSAISALPTALDRAGRGDDLCRDHGRALLGL